MTQRELETWSVFFHLRLFRVSSMPFSFPSFLFLELLFQWRDNVILYTANLCALLQSPDSSSSYSLGMTWEVAKLTFPTLSNYFLSIAVDLKEMVELTGESESSKKSNIAREISPIQITPWWGRMPFWQLTADVGVENLIIAVYTVKGKPTWHLGWRAFILKEAQIFMPIWARWSESIVVHLYWSILWLTR